MYLYEKLMDNFCKSNTVQKSCTLSHPYSSGIHNTVHEDVMLATVMFSL